MPEVITSLASDHNWYKLQRVYERHEGILQQPVAGAVDGSQACAFVRVHSAIEGFTIFWAAESEGMAPVVPDWRSVLSSFGGSTAVVFLGYGQGADAPVVRLSGTGHYWQASCTYRYGLAVPRPPESPLRTGTIPGDTTQPGTYWGDYPTTGGLNVIDRNP